MRGEGSIRLNGCNVPPLAKADYSVRTTIGRSCRLVTSRSCNCARHGSAVNELFRIIQIMRTLDGEKNSFVI